MIVKGNNFSSVLAVGLLMLFLASVAQAQQVTVTAVNGPNYGTYTKWDRFSADIQASVSGTPTPQGECVITSGPTWNWSNPGSGFKLTGDLTSDHVTLQSDPATTKAHPLKIADNTIAVTATAKWMDSCGHTYPVPGSVTVHFFVTVPVTAKQYNMGNVVFLRGDIIEGSPAYGAIRQYDFKCLDNQKPTPMEYGNGVLKEDLSGDNPQEGDTFGLDYADGTGQALSRWTDSNGLWGSTAKSAPHAPLGTIYQVWHCMELTPPYNAPDANLFINPGHYGPVFYKPPPPLSAFLENVNDTPLQPAYTIKIFYDDVQRTP